MVDINSFYNGQSVSDAGDEIVRISTSLKRSDKIFLQQRGFKVSRVLKSAVAELREYEEGGIDYKFANGRLQKKIERFVQMLNNVTEVVEKHGDKDLKEKVAAALQ